MKIHILGKFCNYKLHVLLLHKPQSKVLKDLEKTRNQTGNRSKYNYIHLNCNGFIHLSILQTLIDKKSIIVYSEKTLNTDSAAYKYNTRRTKGRKSLP